ncbi:MAG: hypothetical protein Q9220_007192 [cf. Caloplaca sp. 1 TL-2023]
MVINPTYLAQRTRTSINWQDAKRRVAKSYREWLRSAPEIQQMYSLNMPVSEIRTKVRQEFERHRYVKQLPVIDMLLFQSHSEFQVRLESNAVAYAAITWRTAYRFITAGDFELLEAASPCSEVFSRERKPDGKITTELYAGLLRGWWSILFVTAVSKLIGALCIGSKLNDSAGVRSYKTVIMQHPSAALWRMFYSSRVCDAVTTPSKI